jgi:hypothetical protein
MGMEDDTVISPFEVIAIVHGLIPLSSPNPFNAPIEKIHSLFLMCANHTNGH